MTKPGTCRCCGKYRELCDSHSIPNATFRDLFRRNSGSAILLCNNGKIVGRTQDSGSDYMLCADCESILNKRFDGYGTLWLNEARARIAAAPTPERTTITHSIDADRLLGFFLSVLWRAINSNNEMYAEVKQKCPLAHRLMLSEVVDGRLKPFSIANMSIANLYDKHKQIADEALTQLIIPPIVCHGNDQSSTKNFSYFLVMKGFIVSVAVPPLFNSQKVSGWIEAGTSSILLPDYDLTSFSPIVALGAIGLHKRKSEKTRPKRRRS